VDRARAQSINLMNRCINALRKLQTERGIRCQAFPETDVPPGLGLMDIRQVAKTKPMDTDAEPETTPAAAPAPDVPTGFDALMALADKQLAQRYRDYGMAAFTGAPTAPAPPATRTERWVRIVNRPWGRFPTCHLRTGQWLRIVNWPQQQFLNPELLPATPSAPANPARNSSAAAERKPRRP